MKKIVYFSSIVLSIVCLLCIKNFAFAMMCGTHGGSSKGHSGHAKAAEVKSSKQTAVEEVGNKMCPISGENITEEGKAAYEYKGKAYNFCCPACIDEFKKNPKEYIEKLEATKTAEPSSHEGHTGHPH